MTFVKRALLLLCGILLALSFAACKKEGPAEKMGKKVDEAVEQTKEKMEETGKAMEEATEESAEKMEEATEK